MSGGEYQYIYMKIAEAADMLETHKDNPLRMAFAIHLRKVAEAMHDIEWVDSRDMAPGEEYPAIVKALDTAEEFKTVRAWHRMNEAQSWEDNRVKYKKQ